MNKIHHALEHAPECSELEEGKQVVNCYHALCGTAQTHRNVVNALQWGVLLNAIPEKVVEYGYLYFQHVLDLVEDGSVSAEEVCQSCLLLHQVDQTKKEKTADNEELSDSSKKT